MIVYKFQIDLHYVIAFLVRNDKKNPNKFLKPVRIEI